MTSRFAGSNVDKSLLKVDGEILEKEFANNTLPAKAGTSKKYLDIHELGKKEIRKKRFPSLRSMAIEPFNMIQALLTPGVSAASCNKETLSSSFLILDGFLTISLGELSTDNSDNDTRYNMLDDATERWGSRLETNICVGKVSYEYRHDTEEEEEKCMSFSSSSDGEDECAATGNGSILSQKLDLIPLVLDDPSTLQSSTLNPERYVPPSHKMVADCLKVCFSCLLSFSILYISLIAICLTHLKNKQFLIYL